MYDNFNEGMIVAVIGLAVIGLVVLFICVMAGKYNDASHAKLGTQGHACFANKTCRTEKPLRCVDDGSESGICVK